VGRELDHGVRSESTYSTARLINQTCSTWAETSARFADSLVGHNSGGQISLPDYWRLPSSRGQSRSEICLTVPRSQGRDTALRFQVERGYVIGWPSQTGRLDPEIAVLRLMARDKIGCSETKVRVCTVRPLNCHQGYGSSV
jgi:hypothetical protein